MSFFSRLFRKAPSPSPDVPSAPRSAPSKSAEKAPAKPGAPDRALAAAAEEGALQAAIDSRDFQSIARLVVAGTSTKVRQAAASAIDDPELLRQLIRDVRGGNDKSVYRILTSKRDSRVEQARQREQAQVRINAASQELERHSRRSYDNLYSAQLDQFEGRWQLLASQADPELCDRVQHWIDRSRQTIAEHQRGVEARAALERAAADEAEAARRLREQEAQACAEAATAAAVDEQARVVEDPAPVLSEEQQAEKQAIRQIGDLVRKARGALSDGNTARAASVRRIVEEKLAGAPTLPAALASQLQQLDKQLDELKDWKSFSVAPKRAELIEEMESLIGVTEEPQTLADRIRSLRDEWRTLGKGAGENEQADQQRFQDAAQKAYEPCVEYFAAQALVRKENLQRREAVFARLATFEAATNWEQPDWRTVVTTLREAKQEWRGYAPVDFAAAKPQQERFSTLTATLQARVDAEYARNVKEKESLIERARQLLASEDGRKAIDESKQLQQKWRAVGLVPREVDQRLWGEFRRHSDAVFEKRAQETAAHTASLENNKTQAIALCERIDKVAALEGADLLAGADEVAECRRAFEALGELPRADTHELRNRFDRGLDRYRKSLARQHAVDAERAWSDLFAASNLVREFRLAVVRDAGDSQLASSREAAETHIASVKRWPRGGLEVLKQGLAHAGPTDLAENEKSLRMLCIRAEILTDRPTPPEDQILRREHQLQRLVQNMGQGARADETHLDALSVEWLRVGPVEATIYEQLVQRFQRCRDRGRAMGA